MSKTKTVTKIEAGEAQFSAKKLGANLIATIGDERYSRKVSQEEGDKIIKKIQLYNKKPSDAVKQQIIKMLTPEAQKKKQEKEKLATAKKGVEKQIKKEVKRDKTTKGEEKGFLEALEDFLVSDDEAVEKLQKVLDKHKKVKTPEVETKARITTNPSSGEKYRNGTRVHAYYAYQDGKKVEVDKDGYLIGAW